VGSFGSVLSLMSGLSRFAVMGWRTHRSIGSNR
jgi:hypothetical protein